MSQAAVEGRGPSIDGIVEALRISQRLSPDEPLDERTILLERGLALDSVALLDLVLALEERFAIRIPDQDVTALQFESVASVARLIDRIQRERASANA